MVKVVSPQEQASRRIFFLTLIFLAVIVFFTKDFYFELWQAEIKLALFVSASIFILSVASIVMGYKWWQAAHQMNRIKFFCFGPAGLVVQRAEEELFFPYSETASSFLLEIDRVRTRHGTHEAVSKIRLEFTSKEGKAFSFAVSTHGLVWPFVYKLIDGLLQFHKFSWEVVGVFPGYHPSPAFSTQIDRHIRYHDCSFFPPGTQLIVIGIGITCCALPLVFLVGGAPLFIEPLLEGKVSMMLLSFCLLNLLFFVAGVWILGMFVHDLFQRRKGK